MNAPRPPSAESGPSPDALAAAAPRALPAIARPLKAALAVLGGVLLLVVGVAVFIVATFDPNSYKPWLIETVREERQRTLAIPGSISLTLFPRLGVKLGEVTLSERNSPERFAAIRSAQVSLALWPLLRREVVVDRVALDGLRVRVVRAKNGQLSIDDLLGGAKPAGPFDAIDWRIDFGALAKEAAQAKIEHKREQLENEAKRRLADKLRGVLGR